MRYAATNNLFHLRGFTLVELLVVIAIIGILLALTLPAVEMARESSRRSSCANNTKQIGLSVKLHESSHQTFPTGGWGPQWMGDPDLGFGPRQPGGWIYNILPYVEQQSLRDLGKGQTGTIKSDSLAKVMETPLVLFSCPSRRLPRPYPFVGNQALKNATAPKLVAKIDYAINRKIAYIKSEVIVSDIQLGGKGMSQTIMAGEKSVSAGTYNMGTSPGDQLAMYLGDCDDVAREISGQPANDAAGGAGFGSNHPAGSNVVYCDGSVKFISTDELLK